MTPQDVITDEVLELVRRRGINPRVDHIETRRLVDEVIADYELRSLQSELPRLIDPRATAKAMLDRLAGFGPLQAFLDDPDVEEIWLNSPAFEY